MDYVRVFVDSALYSQRSTLIDVSQCGLISTNGLQPAEINMRTISMCLPSHAYFSGVQPLFCLLISAP